jgi:hypothetical protein
MEAEKKKKGKDKKGDGDEDDIVDSLETAVLSDAGALGKKSAGGPAKVNTFMIEQGGRRTAGAGERGGGGRTVRRQGSASDVGRGGSSEDVGLSR